MTSFPCLRQRTFRERSVHLRGCIAPRRARTAKRGAGRKDIPLPRRVRPAPASVASFRVLLSAAAPIIHNHHLESNGQYVGFIPYIGYVRFNAKQPMSKRFTIKANKRGGGRLREVSSSKIFVTRDQRAAFFINHSPFASNSSNGAELESRARRTSPSAVQAAVRPRPECDLHRSR